MSLLLFGLNHKTAPVELREQLAFTEEACLQSLRKLIDGANLREGLIVSTCNRVEILVESDSSEAETSAKLADFLSQTKQISVRNFAKHFYKFSNAEAVRHLFRVASSLDSMVIGETQILGQVRKSYEIASNAGTVGRNLHKLLHHAFHAAKRVRTETAIGNNAVSISFMAVELGRKIFDSLKNKTVLLIGAGEMSELAAKHLVQHGVSKVLVANRTRQKAVEMATEFNGEAVDFEKLNEHLAKADIVICSTGAENFLITPEAVKKSLEVRRNRPTIFIDISVPRNISPKVGEIPNVFLFDIDDLESVIESNIRERELEAKRAELIIESEVLQFEQSLRALDIGQTLGVIRQKMQETARAEFEKNRAKLGNLTPEQEKAVEHLLISTANKISAPILYGLRHSSENNSSDFAQTLCELLEIGKESPKQ